MRDREGRSALRSRVVAALGCGGAISLAGCVPSLSCEEEFTCAPDPAASFSCDTIVPLGPAFDACGVFVARAGDDKNAGTRQAPMRTLQAAIRKAQQGRTGRVYACNEAFEEAVTLPSGVDLWGGRVCAPGGDWQFAGTESLTIVAPSEPEQIPMRVEAGQAESLVFGVRLQAADAIRAGASSIAMIVNGAAVTVTASEIVAGNGAVGENGEDAPSFEAKGGTPGHPGLSGCQTDVTLGPLPAVTVCDDGEQSIGGSGGMGYAESGGDGAAGATVPATSAMDSGQGGMGGNGMCEVGRDGTVGVAGRFGLGGQGIGSISALGWEGVRGINGAKGAVGQGGGGGGGINGRGMAACSPAYPQGGPSGGSGGGGGCGGKAGTGGGPGGASLGLVALDALINLSATLVRVGTGGAGGRGGIGQKGGFGWGGGFPGSVLPHRSWNACVGGAGGKGGDGGIGGGGIGGPSVAIAYANSTLSRDQSTHYHFGNSGLGGPGGDEAVDGAKGAPGTSGESQEFPHVAPAEGPPR